MEVLPVSHAQSGKALRAFSKSDELKALKAIVATRIKEIRKRPMLDADYQAIENGIARAIAAEPCNILRECVVLGDSVRTKSLRTVEIIPVSAHTDLNLHAFMGATFTLTRDTYSASNAMFPLVVDAPALGLSQMSRDMSIYHYDQTFLNLLGISVLYSECAERLPAPPHRANVIMPVRPGLYYKGHMEPNDVGPDDFIGLDRRQSFNRQSASGKLKRSSHGPHDGYMSYYTTLRYAQTSDLARSRESDTYHALTGLLGRAIEDGLLRRLSLHYIDGDLFPLTSSDHTRINNIIGGLVDIYQDPEFCLHYVPVPNEDPGPARPSMPH